MSATNLFRYGGQPGVAPSQEFAPPPYARRPLSGIAIHLTATFRDPPMPQEFNGILTVSEWRERSAQLHRVLRRWVWSVALRIYIVIAGFMTVFVPGVVAMVVSRKLFPPTLDTNPNSPFEGQVYVQDNERLKARGISLAIFIGMIIVFWLPVVVARLLGRRAIVRLLAGYNTNDAARGASQTLSWRLRNTNTFGQAAVIDVGLPKNANATLFDPRAYMPPHLAAMMAPPVMPTEYVLNPNDFGEDRKDEGAAKPTNQRSNSVRSVRSGREVFDMATDRM